MIHSENISFTKTIKGLINHRISGSVGPCQGYIQSMTCRGKWLRTSQGPRRVAIPDLASSDDQTKAVRPIGFLGLV